MREVHFWFDYISHNAYLAWHGLQDLAEEFDLVVVSEPVVFAGLLNHYGTKGPAELPAKGEWMLKNVLRKARRANIPIAAPKSHPFNPLLNLRASLSLSDRQQRNPFVDRLFTAIWAESMNPSCEDTISQCANDVGLDAQALLNSAADPDIKDALHDQTRAAINAGIFGVPSMVYQDEVFWGYDDLEFLRERLRAEPDISQQDLLRWQGVRPSAKR